MGSMYGIFTYKSTIIVGKYTHSPWILWEYFLHTSPVGPGGL